MDALTPGNQAFSDKFEVDDRAAVQIEYFPVPERLEGYITALYTSSWDHATLVDALPADLGQMMILLEGEGDVIFGGGDGAALLPSMLVSPLSQAAKARFVGPVRLLSAVLSPLGWAAFSGLPAKGNMDRVFDGSEMFGEESRQLIAHVKDMNANKRVPVNLLAERLADFVASHLRPVNPRHAEVIKATVEWLGLSLNPPLSALYDSLSYSQRQVQRLVERYFGLSPKALVLKYRALRVATMLAAPGLDEKKLNAILEHYYDQSHMIREISKFVGRTPARLVREDSPLLKDILDPRNVRSTDPNKK